MEKHIFKMLKKKNKILSGSCFYYSQYLPGAHGVPDTRLSSTYALSNSVLTTTLEGSTLIVPILQIRKLRLRVVK